MKIKEVLSLLGIVGSLSVLIACNDSPPVQPRAHAEVSKKTPSLPIPNHVPEQPHSEQPHKNEPTPASPPVVLQKPNEKPVTGQIGDTEVLTGSTPWEKCERISQSEKINPVTGQGYDFYTLAEDSNRFEIQKDQSVYVIGDIHGSWQMIRDVLINAQIMDYDSPAEKNVIVHDRGTPKSVLIPNLKFRKSFKNKVIFVGDYIAKSLPQNELRTLGLLNDVLTKQQQLDEKDGVIAILGNHDFEAINQIPHPGYPTEKRYKIEVDAMLKSDLLIPTYYFNGVWYSHSYLTNYDMDQFHKSNVNIRFDSIASLLDLGQLFNISQQVNSFVKQIVSQKTTHKYWLGSSAEGSKANFFYAMSTIPADGVGGQGHSSYLKFPMIMGHLSDLRRKVNRVLTEGFHGFDRNEFPRRSHILCVDTSIYHSYYSGEDASFLKINYRKNDSTPVEFENCSIPTRP